MAQSNPGLISQDATIGIYKSNKGLSQRSLSLIRT